MHTSAQETATQADSRVAGGKGLHSVVMEVVEMVENPTMSVSRLGQVIARHRGLSQRVLQIANSPVYAIPGRVSTVQSAITLLGFNVLRDTVITLLVRGAMRTMVNAVIHYEQFWNHSISCGVAARILARRFVPDHADDAFVAGLFHDTGIILLSQSSEPDALRLARMKTRTLQAGSAHEEVGAWLAEEWQLGEQIAEAIRFHHAPGKAVLNPALAATVHVADVLCAGLHMGVLQHDASAAFLEEALEILKVDEASLRRENLAAETDAIRSDVAAAPDFAGMVERLKNALVDGLSALPERQRLTFALYYLEGLSFPEIARVLRAPEAEVRALHAEALTALGQIIQESF
jgi:HD-like signal output (HDOD) protein